MRVLLVDDHAVVRKGMKAILEDGMPSVTVIEASNGEDALTLLDDSITVVVLDLSMPGRGGMEVLGDIRERLPKVPVLIMSLHSEETFAVRALRAGAAGYLTKSAAPDQLVAAVAKVSRGGRYLSESIAERLAADVGGNHTGPAHERLSDREFDVMRAIASGKTVSEIAEVMNLSVKTVSTYRARLLEKLQMSTNAEVTRYAIENKLV
jgi:DNA-binding NarL/FixJ family response regulator